MSDHQFPFCNAEITPGYKCGRLNGHTGQCVPAIDPDDGRVKFEIRVPIRAPAPVLPSCIDELVRAAIAWALADRKADAAADEANDAMELRANALEHAGGDPTRIAQGIVDQCSHASTALDIASVHEQTADEAMREAAKRVARDLGL